ncbi:MAG: hypothetical protein U0132_14190 [Gemmatimonadaceae bacterium]
MLGLALVAQLTASAALPVLAFPQAGLDDSVAYRGYVTRIFRDAAGNTLQTYLDQRQHRVVHIWADGENESIGFTVRGANGVDVPLRWGSPGATVERRGRTRSLAYPLVADAPQIDVGWFLLGSMRVERDFQYWGWHRAPFDSAEFMLTEMRALQHALEQLPSAEQRRHLALLGASSLSELRARLTPSLRLRTAGRQATVTVVQPSLDGRDTLTLELSVDTRRVALRREGTRQSVSLVATAGKVVPFGVRVTTTGAALTRLPRTAIFTPEFLSYLAAQTADTHDVSGRWLERNVRGVELLASREKLMAGLPTYGTYFGRDMLVATLMMRPIWRPEMSEFAIASVLRKLSPAGEVSHEEALGGQADREAASEYAGLVSAWRKAVEARDQAADSLLARAAEVLRNHRRVRENYHMIDDEFQLPVLAARWLADPRVPVAHQRDFLLDRRDGRSARLSLLLRELALVCQMTAAYAAQPLATNLVSFPRGDGDRWASASWRDSGAGYGGGRFAMDVNAIWAPHALEAIAIILQRLPQLGFPLDSLARDTGEIKAESALGAYLRDTARLRAAIDTWHGAASHFVVRLGPEDVRRAVNERLAMMTPEARAYWASHLSSAAQPTDSLVFSALSLDSAGTPIRVANSDPATRLFLGEHEGLSMRWDAAAEGQALRDASLFVHAYPVGLLLTGIGPVVANDAYAPASVVRSFARDAYHGPTVVWGREVNLFLLGAAQRIIAAEAGPSDAVRQAVARDLRSAIARVREDVVASGFRSELWSYDWRDGRPVPVRYGSGGDVQLWSTTDLVVQYTLSKLGR